MDTFDLGGDRYALLEWSASGAWFPEQLSPSERDVLKLVIAGLSNAQIASKRRRSVRTVAHQVDSMFRRLGVASRLQLYAPSRASGRSS